MVRKLISRTALESAAISREKREEEVGEHPPRAGGNISGGRNTHTGKDSKDGYAGAMRLAESRVCQKLIHKQMLIS